ncbi:MAG TPA: hypothetical protein VGM17_14225 [Rhizomicrobium sp.]|jgi:hypothetical protein
MAARDKLLDRMRRNPRGDWQIGDLKAVAERYGIEWRNPSGSHVIFLPSLGPILSVPARRPIKPVYIRLFVEMIGRVE